MGAYYEFVVVACADTSGLVEQIQAYLQERGFRQHSVVKPCDVEGGTLFDYAVLLSPVCNGRVQLVWSLCNDKLGLGDGSVRDNRFAAYLSNAHTPSIHFWLNQHGAETVGYALYEHGVKAECQSAFCERDADHRYLEELWEGPVPSDQPGPRLGRAIGMDSYDFASEMLRGQFFQDQLNHLVSEGFGMDFGQEFALVDYDGACDGELELDGWKALQFRPA